MGSAPPGADHVDPCCRVLPPKVDGVSHPTYTLMCGGVPSLRIDATIACKLLARVRI